MTLALDPDLALSEAAEWSIRLAETPDDEEVRRLFDQWRASSSENAAAWATMSRASAALVLVGSGPRQWTSFRRGWAAVAASGLAAALAIGWVVLPESMRHVGADHVAGRGGESVVLADGSTVRLAPGSAIDVDYRSGSREIRLRDGEALFEVQHDAARPFVVMAGQARTTVLGTGFDVRRVADGAEVGVKHGRVRVSLGREAVVLHAGDRAVAEGGKVTSDHVGTELVGLWTGGKIVAIDRPVGDALEDLDRRFSGRILVDPRLRHRRVTGVYDAADTVAAADTAASAVGGRTFRIGNHLIVAAAH